MIMRVMRRVTPLLLAVGVLLPLMLAAGVGSASAAPFGSCEEPPNPEYPGAGSVGSLDPPQFDKGHPGSPYNEYSYAGQVWNTYGVCPTDINGTSDTYLGNLLFDLGKAVVSITNGSHWLQRDGGALTQLDDLVSQGTILLYDSVFLNWVGLALVLAAVAALWWGMKGNLAQVSKKAMYAIIALTVAAASYLTPLTYTTLADGLLTDGVTTLQNQVLSQIGGEDMQADTALPETLHHYAVYEPWLKGEFGSTDSPEAQRYGSQLLDAQACNKTDLMAERQGGGDGCATEQNQQQYEDIASSLEDTPAYGTFSGKDANRIGAGATALLTAVFFSSFQLMCLLAMFLGLLIIRLLVLMGPVLGAVAIVYPTVLHRALGAVGAAVGYGLALSGVSLGHLLVLHWLAENQPGGELGVLVLSGLLTVVLWLAVKPGRKFRAMAQSSLKMLGAETVSWEHLKQMRMMRSMRRRQTPEINLGGHLPHGQRAPRSEAGGLGDDMPEAPSGTYRAEAHRLDHTGPQVDGHQTPAVAAAPSRGGSDTGAATGGTSMPPTPRAPQSPSSPRGGNPRAAPNSNSGDTAAAPDGNEPTDSSSVPRQNEPTDRNEGGSEPPRVVRPSAYWSGQSTGDTTSGQDTPRSVPPPRPASSYREGRRRVYRVYRPSTGRSELGDDSTPPASRPEQEQ